MGQHTLRWPDWAQHFKIWPHPAAVGALRFPVGLEEWFSTVASILQVHYEASKSAPGAHAHVSQAFSVCSAESCPCCGSHESSARDAADMAAGAVHISNMTTQDADEADAASPQASLITCLLVIDHPSHRCHRQGARSGNHNNQA